MSILDISAHRPSFTVLIISSHLGRWVGKCSHLSTWKGTCNWESQQHGDSGSLRIEPEEPGKSSTKEHTRTETHMHAHTGAHTRTHVLVCLCVHIHAHMCMHTCVHSLHTVFICSILLSPAIFPLLLYVAQACTLVWGRQMFTTSQENGIPSPETGRLSPHQRRCG